MSISLLCEWYLRMSWSNEQIIFSMVIQIAFVVNNNITGVCLFPSSEFCWMAMWKLTEVILWRLIQHGHWLFRLPVNSPTSLKRAAIMIKDISIHSFAFSYFKLTVSLQLSYHETYENAITHGKMYHLGRFIPDDTNHGKNQLAHNKYGQVITHQLSRGQNIGIYMDVTQFLNCNLFTMNRYKYS